MTTTRTLKGETYRCERLPTLQGCIRAIYAKDGAPDGECYETFYDADNDRAACECKGFRFYGRCKHIADLKELFRNAEAAA